MEVVPLTGTLGAEILGADIRSTEDWNGIREAFIQHSVIVVRDQSISCDDHLAFGRRFGPINVNRFFSPVEGYPEIAEVLKEADQTAAVGEEWHTDHAYDTAPALGSILYALETPPYGGDTMFCSMAAAYEALSEPVQTMLRGMKAWHSSRHVFGNASSDAETVKTGRISNAELATQDTLHPVVIRHPLSGRCGLFVNPQFTTHIDGLSRLESDAILEMIFDHCKRPEFQCRIRWADGDLAMWDNRATWHKAVNDYHGYRRHMHRVTIDGCPLERAG